MIRPILVSGVAILLAACASSSGVVITGDGTYLITRSEKGVDTTGSRVKADALKEANTYCTSKGKVLKVIESSSKDMVPFKSDAQAEVQFSCFDTEEKVNP